MKQFPNGFTSWVESHFEIVKAIAIELIEDEPQGIVGKVVNEKGTGGLYELSENLTDEFEELNKGREWDGEFFDEIELFINDNLY